MAEQVQRKAWDDLGDMMLGVQVLAVLDQNTRPEHAARNGTMYFKSAADGRPTMAELPDLPDKPNCRCWSAPVLKPPEEFENDPAVQAAFANQAGANIPDPSAYDQWFARADEGRRKMAVGSRSYNTMRELLGNTRPPEWTDFIRPDGTLLTARELKAESEFERAVRKEALRLAIRKREAMIQQAAARGFLHDPFAGIQPQPLDVSPAIVHSATRRQQVAIGKLRQTNAREAEKLAKELDLAGNVSYRGFDPQIADQTNESLAWHLEASPQLRDSLKFVGGNAAYRRFAEKAIVNARLEAARQAGDHLSKEDIATIRRQAREEIPTLESGDWAMSITSEGGVPYTGIVFNDEIVRDASTFKELARERIQEGRFTAGSDAPKSLTDHEMAHQMMAMLQLKVGDQIIDSELRDAVSAWTHEQIQQELGGLADESEDELIAESWTSFLNNPKSGPIAKQISAILSRRLRDAT